MKTPEELKAQKAKQMREYRQKLREANPEAFLEKQRIQKQKLRAKQQKAKKEKEEKEFIYKEYDIPENEKKPPVKIKIIKRGPPLPSKLPDDIEDDEKTPPPLPKTAPPSLTYKTKNIMKEIKKEIDDFEIDRPVYDVKKFVVEKAFRTKTEQVGNEVLADLIKRMDKTQNVWTQNQRREFAEICE